jgi:hypothetical protein
MKNRPLFLLFLALSFTTFSQEISPRLTQRFSKEALVDMQKNQPENYAMLVYALDNAMYIAENPTEKNAQFPSITVDTSAPYDFITLGLEIKKENQYFLIQGTSKVLVVKSEWVLKNEMHTKK